MDCHAAAAPLFNSPPLEPNDVMTRVKKVRKSGAKALKKEMRIDPSNLLVSSTRNTSSGITRKL